MAGEVGGFDIGRIRAQSQSIPDLPSTIPKFHDGQYSRRWPNGSVVATTLPAIIRRRTSRVPIRRQNHLNADALLIIDGCCKDYALEDLLWPRRRGTPLYKVLSAESRCILVAPDMSVYTDEPMPSCHKLYQIKRTFMMYEYYQDHGLTALPFLAPAAPTHTEWMAAWLGANECVRHVAASVQTLQRRESVWRSHLRLLEQIQRRVPRELVWLLVGQSEDAPRASEALASLGDVRFVVAPCEYGPSTSSEARGPAVLTLPLWAPKASANGQRLLPYE